MNYQIYLTTNPMLEDFIDEISFNNLDELSQQQVLGAIQRHETGHASIDFVAGIVHSAIALAKKQKGLAKFSYDPIKGIGSYTYSDWEPEKDADDE